VLAAKDTHLKRYFILSGREEHDALTGLFKRFSADFMFRLTKAELTELITNCDHLQNLKYRPTQPYAFTEQGVAMLAAVLNSQKAIDVNIQIIELFGNFSF
jgi:hypothetical protein